jgi:hypothetical protein
VLFLAGREKKNGREPQIFSQSLGGNICPRNDLCIKKFKFKLKIWLPFVKQVPSRILIELGAHAGSIWHHHITPEKCVLFKTTFGKLFVGSGRPRFDKAL